MEPLWSYSRALKNHMGAVKNSSGLLRHVQEPFGRAQEPLRSSSELRGQGSKSIRCCAHAMEQAVDFCDLFVLFFLFLFCFCFLFKSWTCMMLRATQTLPMKELNKKVCMDIHTGEH